MRSDALEPLVRSHDKQERLGRARVAARGPRSLLNCNLKTMI